MTVSVKYKSVLEKYNWANNASSQSENINSFLVVLDVFNTINTKDDFKHFRRTFPPEWIYIPAARFKNIELWLKIFDYIYDYHLSNDENFKNEMCNSWIKNKVDFLKQAEENFNKIQEWGLDYVDGQDITVTFCKESTQDIIKKYCSGHYIDNYNKWIKIHPIERKWSINKVLFYKATKKNKYNEKMLDDYEEGKNTKRVCKDFLEYYYNNYE